MSPTDFQPNQQDAINQTSSTSNTIQTLIKCVDGIQAFGIVFLILTIISGFALSLLSSPIWLIITGIYSVVIYYSFRLMRLLFESLADILQNTITTTRLARQITNQLSSEHKVAKPETTETKTEEHPAPSQPKTTPKAPIKQAVYSSDDWICPQCGRNHEGVFITCACGYKRPALDTPTSES